MTKRETFTGSPAIGSGPKRPGPIPVSRSRTLIPFLNFGYERRMPVDRWLRECRLPGHLHDDPETFIPTSARWKCVSLMAHESGIEDLGLRVSYDDALDIMGPHILLGVLREPTLADGIDTFARLIRCESSGMFVWTSLGDESVRFHLKKLLKPDTSGFSQIEWQSLMIMVTMIRIFAGVTWEPDLVALRSPTDVPPLAGELFPGTRFARGRRNAFVEFPRTLLTTGLSCYGDQIKARLSSTPVDRATTDPPADFAESLRRILKSYLPDGYPSLARAAAISGMSGRTLQRRLTESGLSYSTVVDRARFDVATEMLARTDATSLEISLATGYEDPSHFARAFRRVGGCSPREYRRRCAA